MKLYYTAGSCSFAVDIALQEINQSVESIAVDLRTKKTASGEDYRAINPKGYVPALQTDSGVLLTEVPAVLQYVADLQPTAGLAPANGTVERAELQGWLGYINAELHKDFGPLFDPTASEETKKYTVTKLMRRFALVSERLAKSPYLMGSTFSLADAYLYVVLSWPAMVKMDLSAWPSLLAYQSRISQRPTVKAAQAAQQSA